MKKKDGITINPEKISKDIEIFNYLSRFSRLKLNKLSPGLVVDEIFKYIDVIVVEFYEWLPRDIVTATRRYGDLSNNMSGVEEIRDELSSLQNNLLFIIKNFKQMINQKEHSKIRMQTKINLVYDPETNDLKPKFVMFNADQYLSMRDIGNVYVGSALREIFIFTVIKLSSAFSMDRFLFCEKCGTIFFNKTEKKRVFCRRKCAAAMSQRRYLDKIICPPLICD
jgi:hypothetical protein